MKKIKVFLLSAAVLFTVQAFAQDPGKGKVGRTINKIGNGTAHVAVKGVAAVSDKEYKGMVAPGGEAVYINKHSHYYYVNSRGKKVYISKAKMHKKPM